MTWSCLRNFLKVYKAAGNSSQSMSRRRLLVGRGMKFPCKLLFALKVWQMTCTLPRSQLTNLYRDILFIFLQQRNCSRACSLLQEYHQFIRVEKAQLLTMSHRSFAKHRNNASLLGVIRKFSMKMMRRNLRPHFWTTKSHLIWLDNLVYKIFEGHIQILDSFSRCQLDVRLHFPFGGPSLIVSFIPRRHLSYFLGCQKIELSDKLANRKLCKNVDKELVTAKIDLSFVLALSNNKMIPRTLRRESRKYWSEERTTSLVQEWHLEEKITADELHGVRHEEAKLKC